LGNVENGLKKDTARSGLDDYRRQAETHNSDPRWNHDYRRQHRQKCYRSGFSPRSFLVGS
jgi:hypothetical protein